MYAALKALHIIAMVAWFAGLFYLPRLFVYHAQSDDAVSRARFEVMERKLQRAIMTPAAVATLLFGALLAWQGGWLQARPGWLWAKLVLVALLLAYHAGCGRLRLAFVGRGNPRSERWFRVFNEVPTLLLIGIVLLVVIKPGS